MTSVSDYTFFNMARVGEDKSCIDQRHIQNTMACDYLLQNYHIGDCSMRQTRRVATSQPGINFTGTHQLCPGGGNVYESTKLLYDTGSSREGCKLDLFMRPYVTVPCLARGYGNPVVESELQQGEYSSVKKINNDTSGAHMSPSETNYTVYNTVPLIPSKQRVVQNPKNLVEENASKDWVRGGVSSRDMAKDTNEYYRTN